MFAAITRPLMNGTGGLHNEIGGHQQLAKGGTHHAFMYTQLQDCFRIIKHIYLSAKFFSAHISIYFSSVSCIMKKKVAAY